ncbi:MAG: choice-of-anchor D domain-containing protein, partial [Myxococcota bacterium]|nr:choice-of-anchor D domain-containing protein [Myxococcota bacterium]
MFRIVPAILALALLLLPACNDEDCVTGGEPQPNSWQDPFSEAQDIVFSSDLVELSEVEWGASETVEITISNAGNFDLELQSATLESWSSENWEIGEIELPTTLAPDESAPFELIFHNTLEQDSYAALVILSNDPNRERAAVGLIGRSTIQRPEARLSPLVFDFGFQFVGLGTSGELILSNEGASPFVIGEVSLDQAAASPEEEAYALLTSTTALEGLEVPAGGSVPLEVSFLPQNSLTSSAELSVTTDDPQHGDLSALIRGNGEGALGCTAPSITLNSPTAPFSYAVGQGLHLQLSATVSDAEQPPSEMLVELFIGEDL